MTRPKPGPGQHEVAGPPPKQDSPPPPPPPKGK